MEQCVYWLLSEREDVCQLVVRLVTRSQCWLLTFLFALSLY